jgi:hypothetical protein
MHLPGAVRPAQAVQRYDLTSVTVQATKDLERSRTPTDYVQLVAGCSHGIPSDERGDLLLHITKDVLDPSVRLIFEFGREHDSRNNKPFARIIRVKRLDLIQAWVSRFINIKAQ